MIDNNCRCLAVTKERTADFWFYITVCMLTNTPTKIMLNGLKRAMNYHPTVHMESLGEVAK